MLPVIVVILLIFFILLYIETLAVDVANQDGEYATLRAVLNFIIPLIAGWLFWLLH